MQAFQSTSDVPLKLARFELNGKLGYGFVLGERLVPADSLEVDLPIDPHDLVSSELLMSPSFAAEVGKQTLEASGSIPLNNLRLLAPLPRPGKMVCLGRNYMEHIAESDAAVPKELVVFMKPATAVAGPSDDIIYPSITRELDYEGELGVVIGRRCKKVAAADAMEQVLGYLVFDDVTARDLQYGDGQWTRGKSCDTFAPMGPWVTTAPEVADPHSLRIKTSVNGELRQDATTASMIRRIPEIVSTLSLGMTLEPGDVIATGTPAGVGYHWKPQPRLLRRGDVVRIEIEGLGHIENRVITERDVK
jgi:2-keto-4-pentenoate hydratase/2-oxohepta-3-ene-1,7-dioic acid hydratase in catechol pathway